MYESNRQYFSMKYELNIKQINSMIEMFKMVFLKTTKPAKFVNLVR